MCTNITVVFFRGDVPTKPLDLDGQPNENVDTGTFDTTMTFYAKLLVHHPCVILFAVTVVATVCTIIPLVTRKLPDFTDPTLVSALFNL